MTLIIGGAYQGKLDYAMGQYPGAPVFQCDENSAEFNFPADARIINAFHLLLLAQVRAGVDSAAYLNEHMDALRDKVIICDDISCGIVPVSPETRQWREAAGRRLVRLSGEADTVVRVFCGIASVIKTKSNS